jgi:histidinol-phosphatase (PHP family)
MPLPIDYHNHPQAHSIKPYTPELLQPWADSARQKGLKEVCFTDHDRYHQGVDFDQIDKLGSAHYLPPDPEMFDKTTRVEEFAKRDMAAACATYLAELNGMLDRGGVDCLSHLDLIKIHGVWKPEGGLLPHFKPLLERIKREGLAIELSTAGWRKPVGEQYPHVDLLRAAKELGIPFTVASDAHSHAQLAENYDRMETIVKEFGITEVASYRRHKRTMIPVG